MPNVFCVRADYGRYADAFKGGGYVAIGWLEDRDLGHLAAADSNLLHQWYRLTGRD